MYISTPGNILYYSSNITIVTSDFFLLVFLWYVSFTFLIPLALCPYLSRLLPDSAYLGLDTPLPVYASCVLAGAFYHCDWCDYRCGWVTLCHLGSSFVCVLVPCVLFLFSLWCLILHRQSQYGQRWFLSHRKLDLGPIYKHLYWDPRDLVSRQHKTHKDLAGSQEYTCKITYLAAPLSTPSSGCSIQLLSIRVCK